VSHLPTLERRSVEQWPARARQKVVVVLKASLLLAAWIIVFLAQIRFVNGDSSLQFALPQSGRDRTQAGNWSEAHSKIRLFSV
jgi:hypothetical protein